MQLCSPTLALSNSVAVKVALAPDSLCTVSVALEPLDGAVHLLGKAV